MKSSPLLRRGVTLLELLVVLLLLGITAALVLPALAPRLALRPGNDDARSALVATSRRLAIRRGESLRLRLDADGVWALVAKGDGAVVDTGRLPTRGREEALAPMLLTIDALGSCIPSATHVDEIFDPLTCTIPIASIRPEGA